MISAKNLTRRRSKAEGRTFLKYSELPQGTRHIVVLVTAIRETPRLNSPCVIDIAPEIEVDGKQHRTDSTSIPINLTNLKLMGESVGDDVSVIQGGFVTFGFSWKNNPNASLGSDDAEVMGFDFLSYDRRPPQRPEKAVAESKPRKSR